jgi:hypothetical protein
MRLRVSVVHLRQGLARGLRRRGCPRVRAPPAGARRPVAPSGLAERALASDEGVVHDPLPHARQKRVLRVSSSESFVRESVAKPFCAMRPPAPHGCVFGGGPGAQTETASMARRPFWISESCLRPSLSPLPCNKTGPRAGFSAPAPRGAAHNAQPSPVLGLLGTHKAERVEAEVARHAVALERLHTQRQ